jgi:hypothetical protein
MNDLKKFCKNEGLFIQKIIRDTNNGKLVTLEIRTLKPPGKGVVFLKSKWCLTGEMAPEKMLDVIALEFFDSMRARPGPYKWEIDALPKKTKKEAASLDKQIDQILSEEEQEENPLSKIIGLTSNIKNQTPEGVFEALSTQGGLQGIGKMLSEPGVANMFSTLLSSVGMPMTEGGGRMHQNIDFSTLFSIPRAAEPEKVSTPDNPEIFEEK